MLWVHIVLVVSVDACKIHVDSELVKYELHRSSGQVVRDLSGNSNHGMNGNSLDSETSDVLWTDRGAYFAGDQHITLGNALVSQSPLLLSRNFTLVVWLYPLNDHGYIFGSNNDIKLKYFRNKLVNMFLDDKQSISISEGYQSNLYTDKWGMWSLIFTHFPTYIKIRAAYNQDVFDERTLFQIWEDSTSNSHLIGKFIHNIIGFVYEFTLYDQPLLPSVYASNVLFIPSTACYGYPSSRTDCICEIEDPYKNCNDDTCLCGSYSCRSSPNDCIQCECDLNCSVSPPYDCLDFEEEFCSPYAFDLVSLECDSSRCAESFYLQSDSSCSASCPSSTFKCDLTQSCKACHQDCLECTGPSNTDCLSCSAALSTLSNGVCECSSNAFKISSDPLICCLKACKNCSGNLECSECIENASLVNGQCNCNTGFFLNSDFDCEPCSSHCSECNHEHCIQCERNMVLKNNQCFCPFEMYNGECLNYFSLSVDLVDENTIEIKSEERVNLQTNQMKLEIRPNNYTVLFEVFTEDFLDFRINFEVEYDYLDGKYNVDVFFLDAVISLDNNILQKKNYTVSVKYSLDRSFSSLETASVSGFLMSVLVSFVSMITMNEPTVLWTVSRNAQYISYLPLLNVNVSDTLYRFLRTYNNALFIPNLGVKYIQKTEIPSPEAFKKYGILNEEFEDTHVVRNASRFLSLFLGLVLLYVLVIVILTICPFKIVRKYKNSTRRRFPSFLLRLWILFNLDFLVYSSVDIFCSQPNLMSNFLSIFAFVFGNATPFLLFLHIRKNEDAFRSRDTTTMNHTGTLISGISTSSALGIYYEGFMGLRNLLYLFTLYFLLEDPVTFLSIQLFVSVFFFFFIPIAGLFETKVSTAINVLSEATWSTLLIGLILINYLEIEQASYYIELILESVCVGFILFATFSGIVLKAVGKCAKKKTKDVNIAPSQVQVIQEIKFEEEESRQKVFYFLDSSAYSNMSIINRSVVIDN